MLGDNRPNLGLKVLGIQWQCTSDQLVFDLSHIHELAARAEPTKQHIIGFAESFYDPLGILSLFTLQLKILFQELCVGKVLWDEPLSGELLMRWRKLVDSMKQDQSVIIPCCYFGSMISELHAAYKDSVTHRQTLMLQLCTVGCRLLLELLLSL